jgi:hypothetical protein
MHYEAKAIQSVPALMIRTQIKCQWFSGGFASQSRYLIPFFPLLVLCFYAMIPRPHFKWSVAIPVICTGSLLYCSVLIVCRYYHLYYVGPALLFFINSVLFFNIVCENEIAPLNRACLFNDDA